MSKTKKKQNTYNNANTHAENELQKIIDDIDTILNNDGTNLTESAEEVSQKLNQILTEFDNLKTNLSEYNQPIILDDDDQNNSSFTYDESWYLYDALTSIGNPDSSETENKESYKKAFNLTEKRFNYSKFYELFKEKQIHKPNEEDFEFFLILVIKEIKEGYINFRYYDFEKNDVVYNLIPYDCPKEFIANSYSVSLPLGMGKKILGRYNTEDLTDSVVLALCKWENRWETRTKEEELWGDIVKKKITINKGKFKITKGLLFKPYGEILKYTDLKKIIDSNGKIDDKLVAFRTKIDQTIRIYDLLKEFNDKLDVLKEKDFGDKLKKIEDVIAAKDRTYGKVITKNPVDEYKGRLKTLKKRLEDLNEEQNKLLEQLDTKQAEIKEKNDLIKKLQKTIKTKEKEQFELENRIAEIESARKESIKKYVAGIDSYASTVEIIDNASGLLGKAREAYKDHLTYLDSIAPDDLTDHIIRYLKASGRVYKGDGRKIIRRFILSIGSGQLILLSGKPGTGKSTLTKLIADSINAKTKVIPVQPNWTDSTDLLGYFSSNDNGDFYYPTEFLNALEKAASDKERLYFIVLDELNLSRVEYYFAGILSAMERNGELNLIADSLDGKNVEKYKNFRIPENVQFVGTITMDDLSKNISPKVLDRSVIIDLDEELYTSVETEEIELKEGLEPLNIKAGYFVYTNPGTDYSSNDEADITSDKEANKFDIIFENLHVLCKKLNNYKLEHSDDVFGEELRISHRFEKRVRHMIEMGADYEDILITKFLPMLNWELSDVMSKEINTIILDSNPDKKADSKSLKLKLQSMNDRIGDRVIFDYMRSARR